MKRFFSTLALLFCLDALAGADIPQIDYVGRVMLPAGHSSGIGFSALPSSPALYVTTTDYYFLDPATGTFSSPTPLDSSFTIVSGAWMTYLPGAQAGTGYLLLQSNVNLFVYDLNQGLVLFTGRGFAGRSIFGSQAGTFYTVANTGYIYSSTYEGGANSVANTPVYDGSTATFAAGMYVSEDKIATVLFRNAVSQTASVRRFDLNAETLLTSFTLPFSQAASLTADEEGNIYVGNNLGGASVYDSTGQLLTSFVPGANNPVDPNAGTNAGSLFLDDAGDLFVTDITGMHQYAVVPEPSTCAMLVVGLVAFGGFRRSSRRSHPV